MDCVWDTGRTAGEGERFGGDTYRWKNMSESRIMGYARVSSAEQSLARQLVELKKYVPEENIVTDKQSGKDLNRPGYQALKGALGLRRGDVLVIKSLDRLSRNKQEMKQELQWFKEHGIRLKVIDLPTTMIQFDAGQEWIQDMVNNNFAPERVEAVLKKYGYTLDWRDGYFRRRPAFAMQHLAEEFNLTGTLETVQITSAHPEMGTVTVNTSQIDLSGGSWTGQYYTDYPITITATPEPGYTFVGWKGDTGETSTQITLPVTGGISLEAVFAEA